MPEAQTETKDEGEAFRFAKLADDDAEAINCADDERLALMAVCVAHQQNAGFKTYIDLRQAPCQDCGGAGFNTGWGYWLHVCGAEVMSGGEPSAPCGRKPSEDAA